VAFDQASLTVVQGRKGQGAELRMGHDDDAVDASHALLHGRPHQAMKTLHVPAGTLGQRVDVAPDRPYTVPQGFDLEPGGAQRLEHLRPRSQATQDADGTGGDDAGEDIVIDDPEFDQSGIGAQPQLKGGNVEFGAVVPGPSGLNEAPAEEKVSRCPVSFWSNVNGGSGPAGSARECYFARRL